MNLFIIGAPCDIDSYQHSHKHTCTQCVNSEEKICFGVQSVSLFIYCSVFHLYSSCIRLYYHFFSFVVVAVKVISSHEQQIKLVHGTKKKKTHKHNKKFVRNNFGNQNVCRVMWTFSLKSAVFHKRKSMIFIFVLMCVTRMKL